MSREADMQTQALVLRATQSRENDRLITALTEQAGVVRAFANGAKKPKSPLHGATQPFAYGSLELARRRDTYTVTGAQAEGIFFGGLAADLTRLALANYFGALFIELSPREERAPEHLRLALNALHFLSAGTRPQRLLKAVVEMRLVCMAGYMPDLEQPWLDCGANRIQLSPAVAGAMRFICNAPLERAFRFVLPETEMKALSAASQEYLQWQAGKRFEELGYWEGLCL